MRFPSGSTKGLIRLRKLLRQKIKDPANPATRSEFAMGDQPHFDGERHSVGQNALDLSFSVTDVLRHDADARGRFQSNLTDRQSIH